MKARPILFNAPMVRALLDGRKTQTRRVVKMPGLAEIDEREDGSPWPWYEDPNSGWSGFLPCPYGEPGNLLWVRETWSEVGNFDPPIPVYRATYPACVPGDVENVPDDIREGGYRWKPSIHMPRRLSRLTLRITDVRVERLQDISEEDARWESIGLRTVDDWPGDKWAMQRAVELSRRCGFAMLWDSINGAGAWDANPWVWAVSFEVIKANVDAVLTPAEGDGV